MISVVIGTICFCLLSPTHEISVSEFFWNASYSICIGFSFFANGYIFRKAEKRYISWIKAPWKSLFIAFSIHFIYTTVVVVAINWLWFIVFKGLSVERFLVFGKAIMLSEYISVLIVILAFYARSFLHEYRAEAIEKEQLKQEATMLHLQIMQNQVNPHFLFNVLNVLTSLIDIDAEKAKVFTQELSHFYRELTTIKDSELITIEEEIQFVKRYIYLQKIRFGEGFNVEITIDGESKALIIPLSLQMMLENAVKHNVVAASKPLNIQIKYSEDRQWIEVVNNKQLKTVSEPPSNIGLKNLSKRYQFLVDESIKLGISNKVFRVSIPIVPNTSITE